MGGSCSCDGENDEDSGYTSAISASRRDPKKQRWQQQQSSSSPPNQNQSPNNNNNNTQQTPRGASNGANGATASTTAQQTPRSTTTGGGGLNTSSYALQSQTQSQSRGFPADPQYNSAGDLTGTLTSHGQNERVSSQLSPTHSTTTATDDDLLNSPGKFLVGSAHGATNGNNNEICGGVSSGYGVGDKNSTAMQQQQQQHRNSAGGAATKYTPRNGVQQQQVRPTPRNPNGVPTLLSGSTDVHEFGGGGDSPGETQRGRVHQQMMMPQAVGTPEEGCISVKEEELPRRPPWMMQSSKEYNNDGTTAAAAAPPNGSSTNVAAKSINGFSTDSNLGVPTTTTTQKQSGSNGNSPGSIDPKVLESTVAGFIVLIDGLPHVVEDPHRQSVNGNFSSSRRL